MIKNSKRKIDFRMLMIFLMVLLIAITFGLIVIHAIRIIFPHFSAETLWDEISIIPAIGLITFIASKFLISNRTFHLYLSNIPARGRIFIELKRRSFGLISFIFKPENVLEYKTRSSQNDLFIRNIIWSGIAGIDRCEFLVHYTPEKNSTENSSGEFHYTILLHHSMINDYYSISLDFEKLRKNEINHMTKENVLKQVFDDELVNIIP